MCANDDGTDPRWPDLRRRPDGQWAEIWPFAACPSCGLPWRVGIPGRVLIGAHPCRCRYRSHRTYQCERCGAPPVYVPPLDEEHCSMDGPNMMAPTGLLRRVDHEPPAE